MKRCNPAAFNAKFQTEPRAAESGQRRIPTVNHAASAFIQNKRYCKEHRSFADVVNLKPVFIYQTEAI
jgi:hypothetical protein